MCSISEIPDEVLEFILSFISPYKDLHQCLLVSNRWRRCVYNVISSRKRNLNKAISDFHISWHSPTSVSKSPIITKRYSHVAAIKGGSMYVFGGCTSTMTTFNDLWQLDLSNRQWIRPLTMGNYPSPKACCTMVCHNNDLVVFGGWTYPPAYPLHQSIHLFNELHTYNTVNNKWTLIRAENSPPATAGHSATIHGENMIVFGGLQKTNNVVHSVKSNDIWILNMRMWSWQKQETVVDNMKPPERYGHSQVGLDENHILIMGGCGGPKFNFSDMWLLIMKEGSFKWKKVIIENQNDSPPSLWCNPVCKVGDRIIVLSRCRNRNTPSLMYYSKSVWISPQTDNVEQNQRIDSANRVRDEDENVNGKRGLFKNSHQPVAGSSKNTYENKQKSKREERLERLNRLEEKLKSKLGKSKIPMPEVICTVKKPNNITNCLSMYVLDITHATDENPTVKWLPLKNEGMLTRGPADTILYTLVEGNSELVMFGGIKKDHHEIDGSANLKNQVSNSLHFIGAPKYVI